MPGVLALDELVLRPALPADLDSMLRLLGEELLPTEGIARHLATFVVAQHGERLVACGGAEVHEDAVLLRSIAVAPDYRGIGVGGWIIRELLGWLSMRGLRDFYLLTTTAEHYFRMQGFRRIDRSEVHPRVLDSIEFQGACPASAVCMRLVLA